VTTGASTRWGPVAGYVLVSSANQMLWLSFAPVTTVAAQRYGVGVAAVGWLAQIFPLLYVVLALPAGLALDRWFRPGLLAGGLLTAGGAVLRLGDGFGWALSGQVVIALAQPLVLNALTKVVSGYLPPGSRPAGIAAGSASLFAGMLLALVLGAVLDTADDLPLLLRLSAGYAVLAAAALAATLRHPPAFAVTITAAGRDRLRTVWADLVIRAVTGLGLAGFGVFVAMTTWLEALLEPAEVSVTAAGLLLLEMVLAGIVASALLPPLIVRSRASAGFLRVVIVATALGCLALALAPGTAVAAASLLLIGAGLLSALPVLLEIVERRAGASGATAAALLWMAGNAGGLLVALVVQALLGSPGWAFATMALAVLLALPLATPARLGIVPSAAGQHGRATR
jgi:predicted MFS family arabinose efflux permease